MASLRRLFLLLPALTALGLTCVTSLQQRGPAGPWVGEVTNYDTQAANEVAVQARVVDANGQSTPFQIPTCPSTLLPGERGTFELFYPTDLPPAALPLRMEVDEIRVTSSDPQLTGDGFSFRLLETNRQRRYVLVEMTNNAPFAYDSIPVICANLRDPGGQLLEVGSISLGSYPTWYLRPGSTRTFPIFFNSLPEGSFEFVARGRAALPGPPASAILDPSAFRATAVRAGSDGATPVLRVAGELTNTAGVDLQMAMVAVHIDGRPDLRGEGVVGCGGYAVPGARVPGMITIPLEAALAAPRVVVDEITGFPGPVLDSAPVSGASFKNVAGTSEPMATVSASLFNPTNSWLQVYGVCFNLLDGSNSLAGGGASVGSGWASGYLPLAPFESRAISLDVPELRPAVSAWVIASPGVLGVPPPQPVPVPAP